MCSFENAKVVKTTHNPARSMNLANCISKQKCIIWSLALIVQNVYDMYSTLDVTFVFSDFLNFKPGVHYLCRKFTQSLSTFSKFFNQSP